MSPTAPPSASASARQPIPPERATAYTAAPDVGVLGFDGPDAAAFLHGQFSTDVAGMAAGAAGWTSYNSPKGRMLATMLLWRADADSFRAFVAADVAAPLAKRLAMFVLRAKVSVADLTGQGQTLGIAGPGAADAVRAALGVVPAPGHGARAGDACAVAAPDGRYFVHAPEARARDIAAALAALADAIAPDAWHRLGIRAGVPAVTRATQDLFVPQSANWDLVGGVNFRKGCYPGQEIVARMQYLGRLKERLFAFHVAAPPPSPATPVYSPVFGEQACGTVVNAASSPEGGSDLLAVVQWAAATADDALHLGAPDGPPLAARALPYAVPVPAAPDRPKL
jgi:tRNA-modifying protein YgfZ